MGLRLIILAFLTASCAYKPVLSDEQMKRLIDEQVAHPYDPTVPNVFVIYDLTTGCEIYYDWSRLKFRWEGFPICPDEKKEKVNRTAAFGVVYGVRQPEVE